MYNNGDSLNTRLTDHCLHHYQMTNFRLFQTERVCRRQFQIWQKWQKVIKTGRKHCRKRRNCSLRAISPFPTVFSKSLNVAQNMISVFDRVENIAGKGENAGYQHFLLIPQCFQKAFFLGLLNVRFVW